MLTVSFSTRPVGTVRRFSPNIKRMCTSRTSTPKLALFNFTYSAAVNVSQTPRRPTHMSLEISRRNSHRSPVWTGSLFHSLLLLLCTTAFHFHSFTLLASYMLRGSAKRRANSTPALAVITGNVKVHSQFIHAPSVRATWPFSCVSGFARRGLRFWFPLL